MSYIGRQFAQLERSLEKFSIEALSKHLEPSLIEWALNSTGRRSQRVRKLPAWFMVWLVISLALFRRLSIQNILRRLGKPLGGADLWEEEPSSAAVVKARNRLGVKPMKYVAQELARSLRKEFFPQSRWRGMELLIIDGSTFKVPDSPENAKHFGYPGASRGKTAFPQMRAAFLSSATHRFIWAQRFSPYSVGELTLTMELVEEVPEGSLVLIDRNFFAYKLLVRLIAQGAHFLVRVKKNTRVRRLRRLGKGDYLVGVTTPRYLRRKDSSIPEHLVLREIVVDTGGEEPLRLLTSLTDAELYSGKELSGLYLERWEIETSLDEIKTHQAEVTTVNRPVIFRSKSPERVLQEAYGLVIAFNLVRAVIAEAADSVEASPLRISFVGALARIREAVPRMASAPARMLPSLYRTLIKAISGCMLPPRRERKNPRAVKIKMSKYPLRKPRDAS
jgi:hypothetical protein